MLAKRVIVAAFAAFVVIGLPMAVSMSGRQSLFLEEPLSVTQLSQATGAITHN